MSGIALASLFLLGGILWALLIIEQHLNRIYKRLSEAGRPTNLDGSDMVLEALGRIESGIDALGPMMVAPEAKPSKA